MYPISADHMVWTASAPLQLIQEAGVDFDPSDGGRFRTSTQAIESVENALEVTFRDVRQLEQSQCMCRRHTHQSSIC